MTEVDDLDENGCLTSRHVLDKLLPDGFPPPALRQRSRDAYTHVGTGGWTGYWPPEDSAVAPDVGWTEAHRILVLDVYQRKWGRYLAENQKFEIIWPPEANLYTDGYVSSGSLTCVQHGDEDCIDCDEFDEGHGHVTPAEWHWHARIETYEWEGASASLEETEKFNFMTTLMDPRHVDYEG